MNGTSAHSTNGGLNEERPLKVLVAGGGIGGLAAAIFLRQAGHTVEVGRPVIWQFCCYSYFSRSSSLADSHQKLVQLFTSQAM